MTETERIKQRYAVWSRARDPKLYDALNPDVLMALQEWERALWRWLKECRRGPVSQLRLLEVGCGTGRGLLDLLRLGFRPDNLVGNDLLCDRLDIAASLLPPSVRLHCCDALELPFAEGSFDVVLQSTVFTSILDPDFQLALARRMWSWVTPGGGVLWYDFIYNNPGNPAVRGVPFRRVGALFPEASRIRRWRLRLAPPISRIVTRIHPWCYTLLNSVVPLRTHVLCWIEKP